MPEPDFLVLRKRLLQQGLEPRYARRLAAELAEHYDDLLQEAQRSGIPHGEMSIFAAQRLGSPGTITAAVRQRPELQSWAYRHPQIARVALPLAFAALLPAAPFIAGFNHAESVLRWACCAMLSAVFTALLLLSMQLSIALT